jgi:hypothetical protein
MDERTEKVSELLHEAGETHHIVFRITDGADEDWASWYSNWLTAHSELPALLGGSTVRSHVTEVLVRSEREFAERGIEGKWEDYYAEQLVKDLGS